MFWTTQNKAHLALLVANTCFSGWHIVGSLAMKGGANPFVFVLYREVLASALMFSVTLLKGVHIKVDPNDYGRFMLLGLCSFVNVVGAMLALIYISATRYEL